MVDTRKCWENLLPLKENPGCPSRIHKNNIQTNDLNWPDNLSFQQFHVSHILIWYQHGSCLQFPAYAGSPPLVIFHLFLSELAKTEIKQLTGAQSVCLKCFFSSVAVPRIKIRVIIPTSWFRCWSMSSHWKLLNMLNMVVKYVESSPTKNAFPNLPVTFVPSWGSRTSIIENDGPGGFHHQGG